MGESNLVYALAGSVGFLGAGWGRADIPSRGMSITAHNTIPSSLLPASSLGPHTL